jgi:hypothetical protein
LGGGGGSGEPFAAREVANRSIDFLAHLPRHTLPFAVLPRGQKCLSAEEEVESSRKKRNRVRHASTQEVLCQAEGSKDSKDFVEATYENIACGQDNEISGN